MADFKDKFSGKQYRKVTFTALSASVAAASDGVVDGRKHEFLPEKAIDIRGDALAQIPLRIKKGDQSKFFPGLKEGTSDGRIETGSIIRDTVRGIVYVPIKKKNYQENLIGVGSHISTSFSSSAYLQCSAAFAAKFDGVDGETLFTYCVEEFYNSPSASRSAFNVGPLTASFDILESGSTTSSFSAIDTGSLGFPDFEFSFPANNFITSWALRFDTTSSKPSIFYSSSLYVSSAFARFQGGLNGTEDTGSFNLTNNSFVKPSSGSLIGHGDFININNTNSSDGRFVNYTFKTRLSGDADSGSLYNISTQFPGLGQIIIYTKHTADNFNSASFQYHPTSRDSASIDGLSSTFKTLYFYSGSGASSSASANFGFYITGGIPTTSTPNSTPLHTDATFRHNADVGFYSPSGSVTSSIFVQTASGATSGKAPVFAQQLVL
tara:strand:+ start:252 stop:1559 length:1308 start_codon:yes stop_codon:yes gene_type:complete